LQVEIKRQHSGSVNGTRSLFMHLASFFSIAFHTYLWFVGMNIEPLEVRSVHVSSCYFLFLDFKYFFCQHTTFEPNTLINVTSPKFVTNKKHNGYGSTPLLLWATKIHSLPLFQTSKIGNLYNMQIVSSFLMESLTIFVLYYYTTKKENQKQYKNFYFIVLRVPLVPNFLSNFSYNKTTELRKMTYLHYLYYSNFFNHSLKKNSKFLFIFCTAQ